MRRLKSCAIHINILTWGSSRIFGDWFPNLFFIHNGNTSSRKLCILRLNLLAILFYLFICYLFINNALQYKCWRSVRTPGPKGCLKMLCLKKDKNSMTWPRQPWTCNHPIYTQMLTRIYQAVRIFSPCYLMHIYIHRNNRNWLIISKYQ